ncbi:MAG: hypothetical protein Q8S43_08010 [Actinomycetota bacterium]|nr:hypothetical protein [Actinomycetota bacterium]MDP3630879.1 hypothetical protein [Actinomycetota bacterium]
MHRVRIALLTFALVLVLMMPALAFATEGRTTQAAATAWPAAMLHSDSQADGSIADELTLAIMATLAGVVLVSLVFVARRKEL